MEYDDIKRTFILTSGKIIDANCGIIGIAPNLQISEGYDGRIYDFFTAKEKKEIAEYMIGLWKNYGEIE